MISRRGFLIGGVGVVAAGAVGVEVVGRRKVLHELGLLDSPDAEVAASDWPVEEHVLDSAYLPEPVGWAIARPPTPAQGVVLCLHGRNGNHRAAFDHNRLHDFTAAAGLPLAIVGVDGSASAYWHPRADGRDPMAMVFEELLPLVDDAVGRNVPRAVIGWSMGGYGALLFAQQHPDEFAAAVAASPALWHSFDNASDGAFDDAADYARHDVFAGISRLAGMTARVDCGTDDGFLAVARDFAELLPRPNPGGFSEGFHDNAYWRSIAADQLATIADALGVTAG